MTWKKIKRMLGLFDNKSRTVSETNNKSDYRWYDSGEENPFGIRFLDVRSLTWNVVSMTEDKGVAESFNIQRMTDGREFADSTIEGAEIVDCNLTLPHNGEPLEGVVYKADSMDVKWDIYIYDSVFLFVRSWTGQLRYRAFAEIGSGKITIRRIETSTELADYAPQSVYFLLGTHAMGRVLPHTIPRDSVSDPESIARLSFSVYGKMACYATFEDVTQIVLPVGAEREK